MEGRIELLLLILDQDGEELMRRFAIEDPPSLHEAPTVPAAPTKL